MRVLTATYPVKRVMLIGSVAAHTVHDHSDIDIVVEGLPPELYVQALTGLYDLLPAGIELNLIPFEDAFESLKRKAVQQGEVLFVR